MTTSDYKQRLVLASSSQTRKLVLEKLQVPFAIAIPNVDETPNSDDTPEELVSRLAIEKIQAIASKFNNHLIIGSDQVAVVSDNIVGKPKDKQDAIKQLSSMSGKAVNLYTSVALMNTASQSLQCDVLSYQVEFRNLTSSMINSYLEKDQPYDCGGSLRSEGLGIALLKKFEGTDPNILLGLPLIRLIDMLAEENFLVL